MAVLGDIHLWDLW